MTRQERQLKSTNFLLNLLRARLTSGKLGADAAVETRGRIDELEKQKLRLTLEAIGTQDHENA